MEPLHLPPNGAASGTHGQSGQRAPFSQPRSRPTSAFGVALGLAPRPRPPCSRPQITAFRPRSRPRLPPLHRHSARGSRSQRGHRPALAPSVSPGLQPRDPCPLYPGTKSTQTLGCSEPQSRWSSGPIHLILLVRHVATRRRASQPVRPARGPSGARRAAPWVLTASGAGSGGAVLSPGRRLRGGVRLGARWGQLPVGGWTAGPRWLPRARSRGGSHPSSPSWAPPCGGRGSGPGGRGGAGDGAGQDGRSRGRPGGGPCPQCLRGHPPAPGPALTFRTSVVRFRFLEPDPGVLTAVCSASRGPKPSACRAPGTFCKDSDSPRKVFASHDFR